jgi:hypothetical protein
VRLFAETTGKIPVASRGLFISLPGTKTENRTAKYSARMDRISPGTIGRTGEAEL